MFQTEKSILAIWVWNTHPPLWYPQKNGAVIFSNLLTWKNKAETMKGGNGAIGIPMGIFLDASRFGAKNLFFLVNLLQIIRLFIDKP